MADEVMVMKHGRWTRPRLSIQCVNGRGMGRVIQGYVLSPLAAAITGVILMLAQDAGSVAKSPDLAAEVSMQATVLFYVLAFVLGVPTCFALRSLRARSWVVYVLAGAAVGAILAPTLQA